MPAKAGIEADKQAIREHVWALLRERRVARFPGAEGRIPNFIGAEAAAARLAETKEWGEALALKSNPDAPQLPVRAHALADGKTLFMAVPRLRTARPFLRLDPDRLDVAPRAAASIRGAERHGEPVPVEEVPHLDLVVCGSVAVDRRGARVGKGGGFSDLELGLLVETGAIDDETVIATTVHPLQVLDGSLPETAHDFRVDLVVTADGVHRPRGRSRRRPEGILWDDLSPQKIAEIPALTARAPATRG
jgi:5-formyltetrahydrofolate cyclo-ligase